MLSQSEVIAKLRACSRECKRQPAGGRTPTASYVEPPRADVRRVEPAQYDDEGSRLHLLACELPGMMRQHDTANIVTRTRGRMGQGERMLAPAPRMSDGVKHEVIIRTA